MSAESVARWNAIPMARLEQGHPGASTHLKRSKTDDEKDSDGDEEDDDVSLVSRTPSPPPQDAADIDKYDEHIPHPPREVITVETKIKSTNKGFAMLAKLGWSEGQPLGLSGDGRVDPIPFRMKNDLTGLGKINQDVRMIETTVSQRRELDSERQRKETLDQRKAREDIVAKRAAVKSEITDTLRPFYCTLCDKQFQNVAQYDEHTNSYAHHHKARLRDMQANARLVNQEELEKRKEKERKREEKELRKLAKAQGIKMVKPATASPSLLAPENDTGITIEAKSGGFRKGGWAAVTSVLKPDRNSRPSGWAAVGMAAPLPTESAPSPPSSDVTSSRSLPVSGAPMFRAGGWTSLESSSSSSVVPPPSLPAPSPPPPPPPVDVPLLRESLDRAPLPPTLPHVRRSWTTTPDSYPPPQSHLSTSTPLPPQPAAPQKSGWQQWKQGSTTNRR